MTNSAYFVLPYFVVPDRHLGPSGLFGSAFLFSFSIVMKLLSSSSFASILFASLCRASD